MLSSKDTHQTLDYTKFASQAEILQNQKLFEETIPDLLLNSKIEQEFEFHNNSGERVLITIPDSNGSNGVFVPNFFEAPEWFANFVASQITHEKSLCEMGTGSGIGAVLIGSEKTIKILALDINPLSVQCAGNNLKLNKIKNAEARLSDLYENLKLTEKFDICIWNPPFRLASQANNPLEQAIADKNGKLLQKYLIDTKNHLKENGTVYLVFSELGSNYVQYLAENLGYKCSIVAEKQSNWFLGQKVEKNFEFVIFRLAL